VGLRWHLLYENSIAPWCSTVPQLVQSCSPMILSETMPMTDDIPDQLRPVDAFGKLIFGVNHRRACAPRADPVEGGA
jgi:hypothetical protein